MYCMTGRWAAAGTEPSAAGESQPAGGLRAAARRLWGRYLAEPEAQQAAHDPGEGEPGAGGAGHGSTRRDGPMQAGPVQAGPVQAGTGQAGTGAAPSAGSAVPRLLQDLAAWSWRLLLTALLIYVAFRLAVYLRLVVLPFIAAVLLTAVLQPLAGRLRAAGMRALLATWCTFLLALVVIAGLVTLFANRISADYASLSAEVTHTARELERSLAGPPFRLNSARLRAYTNDLVTYLTQHKAVVAGTVLTGGKYAIELLAGLVLMLFITFFLVKDGARIWNWLIGGLRPEPRERVQAAGESAWHALVNWIRGTLVVAAIHALFIGLAIWLLGVPLLVPLVVLVFVASFVPVIGILVAGAVAILVALATKGWVAAVILLAVFILENQIESHLLQPLVVGRIVKLHPLAIILVLAFGGIVAGIPGAIVAVPFLAVVTYAWPALRPGKRDG
jgi:predicted PurR-regulated permease PerM